MRNEISDFENEGNVNIQHIEFHQYRCEVCNYLYKEEYGEPAHGLLPGTLWDDVPISWQCPDCNASKHNFKIE